MRDKIEVKKQGRQWGVYKNGQLIEGGFFDRSAAVVTADTLRQLDFNRQSNNIDRR